MNEIDAFWEFVITENMKAHAEAIKEYCESHTNCSGCGMYNGTCRLNNLPSNWDINVLSPKG